MEDWVKCTDDLPLARPLFRNVSVEVLAKLDTGKVIEAFYAYKQNKWFNANNGKVLRKVIEWQTM